MADIVNVTPPDTSSESEDPAHVAAMVAKAEAGTGVEPTEEPSLLAGKYKSEEELGKGVLELLKQRNGGSLEEFYKELERGDSEKAEAKADETQETAPSDGAGDNKKPEGEAEKTAEEKAADTLDSAGLNMGDFESEFADKGELSAESYEKLQKAGIPKEVVDAYIDGQRAKAELVSQRIFAAAGGEAEYKNMIAWATTSLTDGEKKAFNEAIDSSDPDKYMLALDGLKAKYINAVGKEPKLLTGNQQAGASDTYKTWAEATHDIKNPRYMKDPAFRSQVEAKLRRSNL